MSAGPTRPPTSRFHARRTCSTCDKPLAQAWNETAPVPALSHFLKYSSSAALCSMMYSAACVIAAALRISLLLRLETTGADIFASSLGSHWYVSVGLSSPCRWISTAPRLPDIPQ